MEFQIIDFLLEQDKQKHIFASAFILVFDFFVRFFFIQDRKKAVYAIAFALRDTILIWFLKEFIDLLGFWTPDFMDLLGNSIWFLFPIYLYFSYKEVKKLWKKDFFEYIDEYFAHLLYSLKILKKEWKEGLKYSFSYWWKLFKNKIWEEEFSSLQLFKAKNRSSKELEEWFFYFKKTWKVFRYFVVFIFYSILDFVFDIIKMPFFVLYKTFCLVWKSFLIIWKSFRKIF